MKLKAIYIIPALLCLLFSCTARIDISTKAGKEHLVIYGYLTDELGYHYIKITRSTGYFATEAPEGVSGADVKISTPTTVIHLYEYEPKSGMYIMERMYQGIEGEEYTLDVSLDFNNDGEMERYTASSQLPFAARVDSIDVQKSDALNHRVEVLLYGQLPDSDENHFIFQISRNNQSLDDSLSKFSLISDKYLTEKVINRL
ncbi:DUF4249 domain-containing protein, partial [Odoribacter sp. OttesenSCG-928-J03]|nr:DUF4249 domain-containing protein [Odoribacter sp. OttesenSCG-928-J03]